VSGGFVLVTGAAGAAGRVRRAAKVADLLDRGVPVRAFARTQDHRAKRPRQLGAELLDKLDDLLAVAAKTSQTGADIMS
jgi:hypothetical protein